MTRLTTPDIENTESKLLALNNHLVNCTGHGIFDTACITCGVDPTQFRKLASQCNIQVIPITAGLGVITSFSESVATILHFLGFPVIVAPLTDVTGFAHAIEEGVSGIFMADDTRFIAYNVKNGTIADNSEATGRIYATTLANMNQNNQAREALIVGCGPVGGSAARKLIQMGWDVTLSDTVSEKAVTLHQLLLDEFIAKGLVATRINVSRPQDNPHLDHSFILDATPDGDLFTDSLLTDNLRIAIPGVPPGISDNGFTLLGNRAIHDKLELGVASMAIQLLI